MAKLRRLAGACRAGRRTARRFLMLSPALLAGYRSVMLRPKITGCHGLLADEVDTILTDIARHAAMLQLGPSVASHARARAQAIRCSGICWLRPDLVLVTGGLRWLASAAMAPRVVTPADLIGRPTH